MWAGTLSHDFDLVEQQQDEQARGRMFEDVVRKLFERSRFQVTRNAGAAAPRQTDLFARRDDEEYLIEVKWRKKPADNSDLDNLRARLQRVPVHVVGILFAMAGYGTQMCADLEAHRERVILLFDGQEIRGLVAGDLNLRTLIRRKTHSFIVDGRVLLDVGRPHWPTQPTPDRTALAPSDIQIWSPPDNTLPWITGEGEFGPLLFAQDLPDIDWAAGEGAGVSLDLRVPAATRGDFAYVMDLIRRCIGVTSAARYSIQQSTVCWHGAGSAQFLDALDRWKERYEAVGGRLHESEEVSYFDLCEGGFFTLYAQVGTDDSGRVHLAQFSAQLAGIPLDTAPWRELAHTLDLEDQAYFRPKGRKSVSRITHWALGNVPLEPVAFLRLGAEDWINGIVARNPFHKGHASRKMPTPQDDEVLSALDEVLTALQDVEFLVCGLASYHQVGASGHRRYDLRILEAARSSDVTIVHAVADWDEPGRTRRTRRTRRAVPTKRHKRGRR